MVMLVIVFNVGGSFPPGGTTTVTVNVRVTILLLGAPLFNVTVNIEEPSTLVTGANVNMPVLLEAV